MVGPINTRTPILQKDMTVELEQEPRKQPHYVTVVTMTTPSP